MLELRHLRYFAAVADTLSFTQAAADCSVAQSALSQQIGRLEKDLGTALFIRSSRQVRLTEAGAVLLPWARRLLADAAHAMEDVEALSGLRRGRLRLGVIQTVVGLDLAAVLGEYRARYPGIELSVGYDTSEALLTAVLAGERDLALVGLGPERIPPGLGHRVLHEDRLVAVVPAHHRLAERGHVDLGELSGDALIWFSKGTGLRSAVEAACARAGLTPRQDLEIGLVSEMIRLAAHGLGVAIVPASAVADSPSAAGPPTGARVLRLADAQAVHRVLLVHPADRLSVAARAFIDVVDGQAHRTAPAGQQHVDH